MIAFVVVHWRLILAGVAAAALIAGAAYIYHEGGQHQRNVDAVDTLKETHNAIEQKAKADDAAGRANDGELIDGVR